jgi:class 3 adenylate cyclase
MPPKAAAWLKLVPGALLGGYAVGVVAQGIYSQAHLDNGDILGALMPDPLFMMGGILAFAGLGFWVQKAAGGAGLKEVYQGMLQRLSAKGFASGTAAAVVGDSKENLQESALGVVDRIIAQAWADRKEVAKYKDALSKYTDSTLATKLSHETHFSNVETKKQNMAVLFSDIRGFTKMSETLSTEEVVWILNDYFAFSAEAVHKYNGRINKFIGDAVMAVFEDPPGFVTGGAATKNACNAALQLVSTFRNRTRIWKEKISTPFDADLGAGIHYGSLIFGNMGSPERMEYTAIGDTVNFASRLCSKSAGGQVRISEEVYKLVNGYYELTPEAPITVKGKAGEFKTWLVERATGAGA